MNPTRLRTSLIVLLLSVQVVTIAAIHLGMRRDTEAAFTTSANVSLGHLAAQVDAETRRYLENVESVLDIGARLVASGDLDTRDDAALERYFDAQLLTRPWLSGLMLGREDGSFIYVSRDAGDIRTKRVRVSGNERLVTVERRDSSLGVIARDVVPDDGYDPRVRPWYRSARHDEGIAWTDPYLFFTARSPGITAALALAPERPSDGDRSGDARVDRGVLAVDVDMLALSRFVADVPGVEKGSAMIVDTAGNVVAHSDVERLKRVGGERLASVEDLDDVSLLALFSASGEPVGPARSVRREFSSGDGETHLGIVRSFAPLSGDRRWTLLAQVPLDDYSEGVLDVFAERLGVLIAVLVLSAVVALQVMLRVIDPVYDIHRDATIDPLTGVPNRIEFARLLGLRIRRWRRWTNERLAVVVLDLDKSGPLDDTRAHAEGDPVRRAFGQTLQDRLRTGDIVGRVGGDEFVMALRVSPADDPVAMIERLLQGGRSEPASLWAGVTVAIALHEAGESVADVLARADAALILGKRMTRNRCYLAPPPTVTAPHAPEHAVRPEALSGVRGLG